MESNFLQGIRSSSEDVDSKPVTELPSDRILFPELAHLDVDLPKKLNYLNKCFTNLSLDQRQWISEEEILRLTSIKVLLNIPKYSKKMSKIITICRAEDSWAIIGHQETVELCETMFERINFLRKKTATKPIKQRALVDLFKALKRHSFSSMKWSVPAQLREMFYLLQVPSPNIFLMKESSELLENAEKYFHRCIIETRRLQNEISIFGSQHMSQRETGLMVGFSEHG